MPLTRKFQHESDDENGKSKHRKQHFLPVYNTLWPSLKASSRGEHFVLCTVCNLDFSCAHGGRNDFTACGIRKS
jgi:hypothetical protein